MAGVHVWKASRWALKLVLIYLLSLMLVAPGTVVLYERRGVSLEGASLVRNVIYIVVWASYFTMSKRVKNTFGSNA